MVSTGRSARVRAAHGDRNIDNSDRLYANRILASFSSDDRTMWIAAACYEMLWSPSYRLSLARLLERARVHLSSHATIPQTLGRSQHLPARPGSVLPSKTRLERARVRTSDNATIPTTRDRKSTRLNSSHQIISYA